MKTSLNRVTDLRYLISLSGGNQEFVDEMVGLFIRENPKELETIEKGIRQNDLEMIRDGAHRMKSTIPFVGLDLIIGRPVAQLEQMAKDRVAIRTIEILFNDIRQVCRKAMEELDGIKVL